MMKTLALLLPTQLTEDGRLLPGRAEQLGSLVRRWQGKYRITLILQAMRDKAFEGLPEGVALITDAAAADMACLPHGTYMQRGLFAWQSAPALPGAWDCVLALDGLHPWCLATALYRVRADRRLAYLPCEPELYLSGADVPAFAAAFGQLDGLLCASRWTQEGLRAMFPQLRSVLAHLPFEAAQVAPASLDEPEALHILTVEPLLAWRQAERIPALASQVREAFPALRWHILGEGPRQPYLLRKIIMNDVCKEVIPQGASNRFDALAPMCDGMVHFSDENEGLATSAQALGVPVLSLRHSEGAAELAAWLEELTPAAHPRQPVWQDAQLWTTMIEGE